MMSDQIYVLLDTGVMDVQINEESNNNITKDKVVQHLNENSDDTVFKACNTCKKHFDNENALQNHIRFQHISEGSDSDSDSISAVINNQKDMPTLRLIPDDTLKIETDKPLVEGDENSWVIVKVAKDDIDKKKRNGTTGSRLQTKTPIVLETIRGPFQCSYASSSDPTKQCNRVFYDCCMFSLHFREEHTKRRKAALRCQVCEKRLDRDFSGATLQGLTLNMNDCSTFSCRPCGIVFSDETQYDEHNRIVHVKVKPYQCPICAKRFTQQGGLQQHVRAHSGLKPFACTFCPKAFTQKAGLDQHLRTHTKVKPFKCVICSKCFSQSVHLRQHMRTHTNIQPFECHVCGRKFKQSSHLTFHMRSHSRSPSECSPMQSNQNGSGLSEILGLELQQVEHGGAVYYSAKLPSSLFVNGSDTTSSSLPFTAEEASLDRNLV